MKHFEIISNSQIGARLALKTNIMQRILDLSNKHPHLVLKFENQKMVLAADYARNLFEVTNWAREIKSKIMNEVVEDLQAFLEIIDTFKFDRKVFINSNHHQF